MQDLLNLNDTTMIPLDTLVINLLLSVVLTTLVAWLYTRYGKALSNRARFAQNLPALTMTTVLIISVVQSSLALSLGLVGALSIVRFRTAIKEPEELMHLFLAVAIGLGIGANQRLPTIVATIIIMGYLLLRAQFSARAQQNNLFFNLITVDESATFSQVNEIVRRHVTAAELRRLDNSSSTLQATYLFNIPSTAVLVPLMDELRDAFPACELSFVEQDDTLTA